MKKDKKPDQHIKPESQLDHKNIETVQAETVQGQSNIKATLKQSPQAKWEQISALNKLYKVDRILLKHAYRIYPPKDKQVLQDNVKEYKNIEKFYRFVLDNLFTIEKSYLTDELDQSTESQNKLKDNYQINRNNTSKFIRDEHEHYQKAFLQFSAKVNEDQSEINGLKLYQFVKKCFTTQFTAVIVNGEEYFDKENSNKEQFQTILKDYFINSKDVEESAYSISNVWLSKDQILDFLTHWLKANEESNLCVLYCRTEEKLKKDIQYLKSQAKQNISKQSKGEKVAQVAHPVHLKQQQFQKIQVIQQKIEGKESQILENSSQVVEEEKKQKQKQVKFQNAYQRFRKNKFGLGDQDNVDKLERVKPLSKKQILMGRAPQYFTYGCKRRYPLPKGTTFDQIQSQTKTMNLEKFINFCSLYGVNTYLSRQLLSEIFKMNALHRLIIDEKRFTKILETIIQTDEKTIDCFLQKKPTQNPKLKSQSKLSAYKFMLRPVNGKSIQTLQSELQQKKIVKSKSKQQKLNLYFLKKIKQKEKGYQKVMKKQKQKERGALSSRVLPDHTNLLQLENMRDDRFDPEKFFGADEDELLLMYQSKMQSVRSRESPLESILSKRLQKGNKILQKINSSALRNYQ